MVVVLGEEQLCKQPTFSLVFKIFLPFKMPIHSRKKIIIHFIYSANHSEPPRSNIASLTTNQRPEQPVNRTQSKPYFIILINPYKFI